MEKSNRELLEDLGIDLRKIKTTGKTLCPECSHTRKKKNDPCLSVNIDEGWCNCHNCGWAKNVSNRQNYEPRKREYSVPTLVNRTDLDNRIVSWFEKRGLSQSTLVDNKITNGPEWMPQTQKQENTIQFNYFRDDKLVNVKYRDGSKNFKMFKDAELIFYGLDHIKNSDWCVIVEGEPDKLAYWEAGVKEVVSVPNGASKSSNANLEYLDNCIEYFSNKKKIIIATDEDGPGRSLRDELARRLGYHRCYKVDFKGVKDANEFLLINGKLGLKDTVKEENLSEFPIAGTISIDDIWPDVQDLFVNGLQKGDVTKELREFDKLVSFVPGQLMVVTGIPNHGKSPFVLMLAACLSYHHGWKWAFFTPEHKPLKIFVAKICEMLLGKRMRKGIGFTEYEQNLAKEFIRDHFVFIEPENDENKLEFILSTAESLVMRKGIRGLVIDPWNKIEHEISNGDNETNYISRALDRVISFNQRFNVFGIIVAHPTKIRKKAGKTVHEIPTLYDISGSSNWFNKPDWGITYYRNYEEGGKGEVYVQKAKYEHLGSTGVCELKYNMNNGRFCDYHAEWDNTNWLAPNVQQASLFEEQEKSDTFANTPPDMEDSPF